LAPELKVLLGACNVLVPQRFRRPDEGYKEMAMHYTYEDIAKMIDHSLLNPSLSRQELEDGCTLAVNYRVASVCIVPFYLQRCAEQLTGTSVVPSTTIGFPHGGHATTTKLSEARQALGDGARELDMVVNINAAISGDWNYVRRDIGEVIALVHDAGQKVKVIFENCYLNDEQKTRLCAICGELKADWVKTSTGYGSGGATLEDLVLMRRHSPPEVQIKAAGGIRDLDTLLRVREIGVTRVGASRTASVLDEARKRLNLPAPARAAP
jgi:deoxyribose-phosphate aldolase